ncbi:MAG: ROK family protein [Actinobacteria bacterium]|nr:ROK family protein [Actinomycetota bacterium]
MAKKASVRDVRRSNRALLLRRLVLAGETSRSDLGAATGLSAATVTNVVAELIDEGTVNETGFLNSAGGRRRVLLHVDPDAAYVFGSDVSESQVTTCLFGLTLTRLASRATRFTGRRIDPARVGEIVAGQVAELLAEAAVDPARVLGLGLGVPGVVEHPATPDAVVHADVIGWDTAGFGWLEAALGIPVLVDNGAKTTTQAESWYGSARGAEHAIVALIGDGAGAGIITNGRLYRGASSGAGEWGHTKISLTGPACRCGSFGCVESIVGASAVLRSWRGADEFAGREPLGVEALLDAYRNGDSAAVRALDEATQHLGLALANLVNLYNPEKIIVGGWFGDLIARDRPEELRAAVRRFSLKQPGEQAVVERSQLGMDAVTLGAATLPVDRFIETGLIPSTA